jgi:hypothetical protein
VGRLTAWADAITTWRRAGDARVVPHIVVSAVGLARRLPAGLGLALNPDSAPGVPLYPECVSYLARLSPDELIPAQRMTAARPQDPPATRPPFLVGHPPTEPAALLREARDALRTLPSVRHAARAWLSVADAGEGLVISVTLDDPSSEPARDAVTDALARACASVPLRVPFPVDVTFPGEHPPGEPADSDTAGEPAQDLINDWITRNTRPFYTRGESP